jgi:hypothetical protein
VALNLGPAPGWWALLPPLLLALGIGVVTFAPARHWFSLETQSAGAATTIVVTALVAGVLTVGADVVTRRRLAR